MSSLDQYDIYLTGNPQIVYRRHTNFAIESIEQTFNGTVGFGRAVSCTISRNGDLVGQSFLQITLKKSADAAASNTLGSTYDQETVSGQAGYPISDDQPFYPAEAVIQDISLEIGGQPIDKHTATWYRVYDELFRTGDEKQAYYDLTSFTPEDPKDRVRTFYLPLLFFFTASPGLALPLIALQYHEVKIKINFTTGGSLATLCPGISTADADIQATLFCDYIYLDSDERRRFAQVSHEYLITQVQFTGAEVGNISPGSVVTQNIRLNFNHPTKYLAWVAENAKHGQFTGGLRGTHREAEAPLKSAKLQLNGHDRFSERAGFYFNRVQSFQSQRARPASGVYMYSFALRPEEHQPSGTVNMSRIDASTLLLTWKKCTAAKAFTSVLNDDESVAGTSANTNLKIFAVNYNVLRIMSGMGGLAYAN